MAVDFRRLLGGPGSASLGRILKIRCESWQGYRGLAIFLWLSLAWILIRILGWMGTLRVFQCLPPPSGRTGPPWTGLALGLG